MRVISKKEVMRERSWRRQNDKEEDCEEEEDRAEVQIDEKHFKKYLRIR